MQNNIFTSAPSPPNNANQNNFARLFFAKQLLLLKKIESEKSLNTHYTNNPTADHRAL